MEQAPATKPKARRKVPIRLVRLVVEFELPSGASVPRAKQYVDSAVRTECGQLHPDDPMHDLNRDTIRVWQERRVR